MAAANRLQKVLPKLHGNRRTLSDSLRALSAFLAGKDNSSAPPASYTLGLGTKIGIAPDHKLVLKETTNQMSLSRSKLDEMHDRLIATGYVSFIS